MNKMLLMALVFFFGLAPIAFAQGFVPLAPIPGLTEGATTNPAGLATFFNNLYKYLIGLAAVLAVIQITWAGLDIAIFHKDAVSAITDDKGKIYNAIFGLILVLSPVLVFSIINPSILNLSLNLPPLQTTSTVPTLETGVPYSAADFTGKTIPQGKFCYKQATGLGAEAIPRFVCFTDSTSCVTTAKKDGSAVNGECRQM